MKKYLVIMYALCATNIVWGQYIHEFTLAAQINEGGGAFDVTVGSDSMVFLANGNDGLRAYSYGGSAFISAGHINDGELAMGVTATSDGTVFLANGIDGLRAYSYDGSAFTSAGHINVGDWASGVMAASDGTVFLANGINGLRAYSYDGSAFTSAGHINDGGWAVDVMVASDGTVFLANASDGLHAYSYDGSAFTSAGHINDGGSAAEVTVGPDNTVFLANGIDGLRAYSYDGSAFTSAGHINDGGEAAAVTFGPDSTVFLANGNDGLHAYSYDGSAFTSAGHINDGGYAQDVTFGPDSTVFLANGIDGLRAYSYQQDNILGPIVVNEILQNPSIVTDSEGEWFELYNPNAANVYLQNWTILDNGSDLFNITDPIIIPSYGNLVFGSNSDISTNGGVEVDYEYSGFTLGNSSDEIIIRDAAGRLIDSVAWDGGPNFPDPNGASMSLLDPMADNTLGLNWEESTIPFGLGDLGTPGLPNYIGILNASEYEIQFDTTTIGISTIQNIVLYNRGNLYLTILSVGTGSTIFLVDNLTSAILSPGDSLLVTISFSPDEYGVSEGSLTVISDAYSDSMLIIPLSGFGYIPFSQIELSTDDLVFPQTMMGAASTLELILYSTGVNILLVDTIFTTLPEYQVSTNTASIDTGDSLIIEVTFLPSSDSLYVDQITISSNDSQNPILSIALSGSGIGPNPDIDVDSDLLNFGAIARGDTSSAWLTVFNLGVQTLEISDVIISQPGESPFWTFFEDAAIDPGDSTAIEIFCSFSPDHINSESRILTIYSNDPDEDQVNVLITGGSWRVIHIPEAYTTIQEGIDVSAEGDTVVVHPGLYFENLHLQTPNIVLTSLFYISGDLNTIDSTIIDGGAAGRVLNIPDDHDSSLVIHGLTIQNGFSDTGMGGGVYATSDVTFRHCIIQGNRSTGEYTYGGGIYVGHFSRLILENVIVRGNSLEGSDNVYGAGIFTASYCSLFMRDCLIESNSIVDAYLSKGGGIFVSANGDVDIARTTIANNSLLDGSGLSGGGLCIATDSNVLLDSVEISGNICDRRGAGISGAGALFGTGCSVILNSVKVSGNIADGSGARGTGLSFSNQCNPTLSNVQITDNLAHGNAAYGAGIYLAYENQSTLSNVTISNNINLARAGEGGGGGIHLQMRPDYDYHNDISLVNTIIWGNYPDDIFAGWIQNELTFQNCDVDPERFSTSAWYDPILTWLDGNITADPLFCNPDSGFYTLAENSPCVGTGIDQDNMGSLEVGCDTATVSLDILSQRPSEYRLYQNYPNPFNPTTTISYDLPEQAIFNMTIFNIRGQEVMMLEDASKPPGNYEVQWNGLDRFGNPVSTGVYFCRLEAGTFSKTIKMVYLR